MVTTEVPVHVGDLTKRDKAFWRQPPDKITKYIEERKRVGIFSVDSYPISDVIGYNVIPENLRNSLGLDQGIYNAVMELYLPNGLDAHHPLKRAAESFQLLADYIRAHPTLTHSIILGQVEDPRLARVAERYGFERKYVRPASRSGQPVEFIGFAQPSQAFLARYPARPEPVPLAPSLSSPRRTLGGRGIFNLLHLPRHT